MGRPTETGVVEQAGAVVSAVQSTAIPFSRIAGSEIENTKIKLLRAQHLVLLIDIVAAAASGVSLPESVLLRLPVILG